MLVAPGCPPIVAGSLGTGGRGYVRKRIACDEVLGEGTARVLLAHYASEEQHGAAWPVIHHQVLGLSLSVALNRDDNAGGLALDLAGVLLDETVGAVIAGELELLVLIQRAGVEHESSHILRALQDALHRRALRSDVVGQVVQPPRIILARGRLAKRVAASSRCHIVPPSESGSAPAAMREAMARCSLVSGTRGSPRGDSVRCERCVRR